MRTSGLVLGLPPVMRLAIKFNDKFLFDTGEVRDERANWMLSTKLYAKLL